MNRKHRGERRRSSVGTRQEKGEEVRAATHVKFSQCEGDLKGVPGMHRAKKMMHFYTGNNL